MLRGGSCAGKSGLRDATTVLENPTENELGTVGYIRVSWASCSGVQALG